MQYYKHTAFSGRCYSRLPHEEKISPYGKYITGNESGGWYFFSEGVIFFYRVLKMVDDIDSL